MDAMIKHTRPQYITGLSETSLSLKQMCKGIDSSSFRSIILSANNKQIITSCHDGNIQQLHPMLLLRQKYKYVC